MVRAICVSPRGEIARSPPWRPYSCARLCAPWRFAPAR